MPAERGAVLRRLGRRPTTNARWRLQRYGRRTLEAWLADADLPVFLTFGSLLGWIRDGGFIQHDDDIDLGLLDADWPRIHAVAEALSAAGWQVAWFGDDEVRFWHPGLGGVAVDVFRFRRTPDGFESRAYSAAGEHVYHFRAALIAPLRAGEAFGLSLRLPADAEGLLAAHYGAWQVPDAAWDYRTDAASARSD